MQVPQTGNVTVPEDSYDRFYGYASAEPPNYPAACKVLVEAAAADTVMTTALDTRRDLSRVDIAGATSFRALPRLLSAKSRQPKGWIRSSSESEGRQAPG